LLCNGFSIVLAFSTQYVLTDAQRQQFVSRINQMRSTTAASDMREIVKTNPNLSGIQRFFVVAMGSPTGGFRTGEGEEM